MKLIEVVSNYSRTLSVCFCLVASTQVVALYVTGNPNSIGGSGDDQGRTDVQEKVAEFQIALDAVSSDLKEQGWSSREHLRRVRQDLSGLENLGVHAKFDYKGLNDKQFEAQLLIHGGANIAMSRKALLWTALIASQLLADFTIHESMRLLSSPTVISAPPVAPAARQ